MADENRVTYIVSWNRVRRVVMVVVGGKKVLIQRLPLTRARAPAVGIGQWQQVAREERERNVNEREKLSYFVWKYLGLYLGLIVSIWNKKREEYIPTRFFFYKIFSFGEERWFLLIEICFSIIYGVIVKKSLAKDEKKLYFAFTWMDY